MLDAVLELTYSSWAPAKLLAFSVHGVCSHAHAVLRTFCRIDRRKGFSLLVTGAVRPKLHHTHVHPYRLRFQQNRSIYSATTPLPSPPPPLLPTPTPRPLCLQPLASRLSASKKMRSTSSSSLLPAIITCVARAP